MNINKNVIWIAKAHVKPKEGFENILDGYAGAYLQILVKANYIRDVESLAKKIFFEEGFVLEEELKDVELLSERLKWTNVASYILDLVDAISETHPVQFGHFHSYPKEDLLKLVKKDNSDKSYEG